MKHLLIIFCIILFCSSCKKDKSSNENCDRVNQFFYDNRSAVAKTTVSYNADGTAKEIVEDNGNNKYRFDYRNGNQTVLIFATPGVGPAAGIETRSDSIILNSKKFITYRKHYFTDGYTVFINDYDQDGFLIKLDATNYDLNGVVRNRQTNIYTNTLLDGNLVKKVEKFNNGSFNTYEYEYKLTDAYVNPDYSYYNLISNPGNQSKNLMVKIRTNGAYTYNITYLFDGNKRVTDIKHTSLNGSNNEPHYAINYACQ